WRTKCGVHGLPRPNDINPSEIPKLLPYLTMVDVLDEVPPDFIYRIEGDAVRQAFGHKRRDKRISELGDIITPSGAEALRELYAFIVDRKQPAAVVTDLTYVSRHFYEVEPVYLPLARDGVRVHRVLSCLGIRARPEDRLAQLKT